MHEQLYACERDILSFMYAKPHDEVFTVEDFDALGSYDAVRKALSRLAQSENIERISMGLYRLNPNGVTMSLCCHPMKLWRMLSPGEAIGGYFRPRSLHGAGSACPMKTRICRNT